MPRSRRWRICPLGLDFRVFDNGRYFLVLTSSLSFATARSSRVSPRSVHRIRPSRRRPGGLAVGKHLPSLNSGARVRWPSALELPRRGRHRQRRASLPSGRGPGCPDHEVNEPSRRRHSARRTSDLPRCGLGILSFRMTRRVLAAGAAMTVVLGAFGERSARTPKPSLSCGISRPNATAPAKNSLAARSRSHGHGRSCSLGRTEREAPANGCPARVARRPRLLCFRS
jgi:hypothetical protein